jgi:transglutaminase superfamily protein
MEPALATDKPLQEDRLSVKKGLSGVVLKLVRPWPRPVTRRISAVLLLLWAVQIAALVNRSYLQASPNLATDLARYGSNAQWRGVYYRGEKIGFTVGQTVPVDEGFELQEDGQLQMTLLGATTMAQLRTTARVDEGFALRSFAFSLDAGTGPVEVRGRVNGRLLTLDVVTGSGTRTEERQLAEPPMLTLNLSRRLASGGLTTGAKYEWTVFDPATLRNAPVIVDVGQRELVRAGNTSIPAFRIGLAFAGLQTTSWMTDTGEVIREESPLGLISIKESADQARAMAVPKQGQTDLLQAAAVVPVMKQRIDDPRDVLRLRLRLEGADLSHPDLQGAGQSIAGNVIEIRDPRRLSAHPADPDVRRYLAPEPLIESDAAEIVAETERAVGGITGARARAEQLTRYVNGLLEKKPTVSLPSAREVLRTKVGDCNEHTSLYVAMARAAGIPARVAVGLVYVRGAFYYHAWPEVYLTEGASRGLWLPVDPTFNQFPADATHLRLARGGLDRQAAILPMIGHLKMTVLDLELVPGSTPILIGAPVANIPAVATPAAGRGWCWCASAPRP